MSNKDFTRFTKGTKRVRCRTPLGSVALSIPRTHVCTWLHLHLGSTLPSMSHSVLSSSLLCVFWLSNTSGRRELLFSICRKLHGPSQVLSCCNPVGLTCMVIQQQSKATYRVCSMCTLHKLLHKCTCLIFFAEAVPDRADGGERWSPHRHGRGGSAQGGEDPAGTGGAGPLTSHPECKTATQDLGTTDLESRIQSEPKLNDRKLCIEDSLDPGSRI